MQVGCPMHQTSGQVIKLIPKRHAGQNYSTVSKDREHCDFLPEALDNGWERNLLV